MRRISVLLVAFSFILIIGLFVLPQPALAALCNLNVIAPNPVPSNFNGQITVKATDACPFSPVKSYWVIAYPDVPALPAGLYSGVRILGILIPPPPVPGVFSPPPTYPPDAYVKPSSTTSLTTNLNLDASGAEASTYIRGSEFPDKKWIIAVCASDNKIYCNDKNNFMGMGSIMVGPVITPTPTTPAGDFPIIDRATQTACAFQAGTAAYIDNINNLQPSSTYSWWWEGDKLRRGSFKTSSGQTSAHLSILETETKGFLGDKKFCVDLSDGLAASSRGCGQNSILITFTAGVPSAEEARCTERNSGLPTPTPTLIPNPPPPCPTDALVTTQDFEGLTYRCTAFDTAIGRIDTDPGKFVKSIFSILLSLSGGIAALLIMFSGYRIITAQANAEKLQEAREMLFSAIVGLLFIIFSLIILQVIGVDILHIPGFNP